jgi:hypothetical protein
VGGWEKFQKQKKKRNRNCLWNLCRPVQFHQYSQMGVNEKWFGSHQRINCSVKSPIMVLSKPTWTNALENAREAIHCAAYFYIFIFWYE